MLIQLAHASRIAHSHGTLPSWAVGLAVVVAIVGLVVMTRGDRG